MKIKAVIRIAIPALFMAVTLSPIHAQTAGEILKAYEGFKKAGAKKPAYRRSEERSAAASFTAH